MGYTEWRNYGQHVVQYEGSFVAHTDKEWIMDSSPIV